MTTTVGTLTEVVTALALNGYIVCPFTLPDGQKVIVTSRQNAPRGDGYPPVDAVWSVVGERSLSQRFASLSDILSRHELRVSDLVPAEMQDSVRPGDGSEGAYELELESVSSTVVVGKCADGSADRKGRVLRVSNTYVIVLDDKDAQIKLLRSTVRLVDGQNRISAEDAVVVNADLLKTCDSLMLLLKHLHNAGLVLRNTEIDVMADALSVLERVRAEGVVPTKALVDMTEPELTILFRRVARSVEAQLPPDTGFVVLASPRGTSGVSQYVGNTRREDAAAWMLETVARWNLGEHVPR